MPYQAAMILTRALEGIGVEVAVAAGGGGGGVNSLYDNSLLSVAVHQREKKKISKLPRCACFGKKKKENSCDFYFFSDGTRSVFFWKSCRSYSVFGVMHTHTLKHTRQHKTHTHTQRELPLPRTMKARAVAGIRLPD